MGLPYAYFEGGVPGILRARTLFWVVLAVFVCLGERAIRTLFFAGACLAFSAPLLVVVSAVFVLLLVVVPAVFVCL